jgi:hypothetical protein
MEMRGGVRRRAGARTKKRTGGWEVVMPPARQRDEGLPGKAAIQNP